MTGVQTCALPIFSTFPSYDILASDFEGCVYIAHSPLERASTGTLHLYAVLMFDNEHRKTEKGLRKLLRRV